MKKVLLIEEGDENRFFLFNDETDLFKIALTVLRERYDSQTYPTSDQARQNFRDAMQEISESEESFIAGDKSLDTSEQGCLRRKGLIDDFRIETEKRFLPEIDFCERVEELLSAPEDEALDMQWIFDDGSRVNLAWMLLSQRRGRENEGFQILNFDQGLAQGFGFDVTE